MLAKCDLRAHQILIDKNPNTQNHAIANLSEADILIKANHVIRNIPLPENDGPLPKVTRIKKLPSRAFFLEMDSKISTDLLKQTTLAANFIKNFRNTSIIKTNNYLIIVEFTPTTFNLML